MPGRRWYRKQRRVCRKGIRGQSNHRGTNLDEENTESIVSYTIMSNRDVRDLRIDATIVLGPVRGSVFQRKINFGMPRKLTRW
jgi:hypothetical protein